MAPVLEFRDLALRYHTERGAVVACEGVNLSLMEGERLILLGPSGCGKSSLLAAAGGFLMPAAGQVLLDGAPVRVPGPDRMTVFQEFDQLLPWKRVRANVAYPRASRAGAAPRRRNGPRLSSARSGCAASRRPFPHPLRRHEDARRDRPRPGRRAARAADGRALRRARRPHPPPHAGGVAAALGELRFTLIFVTHSIEEAVLLGSRVAVLSAHPGRLRAEHPVPADVDDAERARLGGLLRSQLLPTGQDAVLADA